MTDEEREKAAAEGFAFLRTVGIIAALYVVRRALEIWLPDPVGGLVMAALVALVFLVYAWRRRFRLGRAEWIAMAAAIGFFLVLAFLP